MNLQNLIPMRNTDELIEVENGQPVTTSLKVAEIFGKQHSHVMRDIQDKILPNVSENFNQSNFGLVSYKDAKGEYRPMYYITRDGFTMLAMGYTGPTAMLFKEMYINEFNKMAAMLQKKRPNNDDLIDQAATKITAKLFPQFVKTVSSTLSKDIVERIRSLPQGEQLLQPPEPTQQPKPKRQTITLYIVIAWDDENGTQVYKTKDYDKFIALVKDITLQGKQYTVERIKTTSYK